MLVDTILEVRFLFSSVRFLIIRASLMKVESLLQCNEFSDLSKFIKLYSEHMEMSSAPGAGTRHRIAPARVPWQ